ncbi:MAG: 50S ribosomal protein L24 [Candidatus Omnitrophica bacterium]|nr:50S ribosomal protein L24 [Candidatus Omnitrophota bacterium]
MFKIRKNDTVEVVKGKDVGKKGKVLQIFTDRNKAIVEGINLVKKHRRQTRQDQPGGLVSIEAPISLPNLLVLCKHCDHGVRVGFKVLADGTKSRVCKDCNEVI